MLSSNALTTLERARDEIGVDESKNDYVIQTINLASEIVERFCNRKFGLNLYRDLVIVGSDEYLFSQFPVRRLIALDGQLKDHARLDKDSGILYEKVRDFSEIDYEAGYDLPGSVAYESSDYPLPFEIEHACLQLCKHLYADDETPAAADLSGLKSVDMGDITVSLNGSTEYHLPQAVVDSLAAHRKVNV